MSYVDPVGLWKPSHPNLKLRAAREISRLGFGLNLEQRRVARVFLQPKCSRENG
jgi:hypothetical protein